MKRTIFLHLFLFTMLQLAAQSKTVNIHGVVKDTTVKSIEITYVEDAQLSKWANTKLEIVKGEFNATIKIPFPVEAVVSYKSKIYRKNFIYTDTKLFIDTAGELHIIGSPQQNEYENEFLLFFKSNNQVYDSLLSFYQRNYSSYGRDFPKEIKDSANLLITKYYHQRAYLLSEYIKLHPDSYVALWDINYFVSIPPSHQYFDFEKLFSSFSNQMQKHSFINVLKEKISVSAKMQLGQTFPEEFFKGYEEMHNKIKKNSQYYLIDFWYSHCLPCAKEFPKLQEIYKQFHNKGFDIVSISVDKQKDKKEYIAAIKRSGLVWNLVWDKDGIKAEKYNINVFPTYILLDRNGIIINSDIRVNELETFLKKSLGDH